MPIPAVEVRMPCYKCQTIHVLEVSDIQPGDNMAEWTCKSGVVFEVRVHARLALPVWWN